MINVFMINMFINRVKELKTLRNVLGSDKAQLILLYGRRRVGKTSLILKLLSNVEKAIYLYTPEASTIEQLLETYSSQLVDAGLDEVSSYRDFLNLLSWLGEYEWVVAIDEFQRLYEVYKPSISLLQDAWDRNLSRSKIKLILAGSTVGLIERIGLRASAPLFGRVTCMLKVKPMSYIDARGFYAGNEHVKFICYSYFGGTPAYASRYNCNLTLRENIERLVSSIGAPLLEEPMRVLSEETRRAGPYCEIMSQLSRHRGLPLSKIKVRRGSPTEYLATLMRMDLIEKIAPPTERDLVRPRRAIYRISDMFFNFWFRYIYPNLWKIELGKSISKEILDDQQGYLSHTAEKILSETLPEIGVQLGTYGIYSWGPWWHKEIEIDFVGIGENNVLLAELKWSKLSIHDVNELAAKAEYFREVENWHGPLNQVLIGLSYSKSLKHYALNKGVKLYTVDELKPLIDKVSM